MWIHELRGPENTKGNNTYIKPGIIFLNNTQGGKVPWYIRYPLQKKISPEKKSSLNNIESSNIIRSAATSYSVLPVNPGSNSFLSAIKFQSYSTEFPKRKSYLFPFLIIAKLPSTPIIMESGMLPQAYFPALLWVLFLLVFAVLLFLLFQKNRTLGRKLEKLEADIQDKAGMLNRSRNLLISEFEERLAAEEELRKSQFQFSLVWEKSIDGMRITDEKGTVIKVNDAFCRMVEKTREEMEGRPFSSIYEKIDQEKVLKLYRKRFRERSVEPYFEREFKMWNGKVIWFEVSSSFLELDNNNTYLLLIFRNISERKNTEKSLIRYACELESLNEKLAESENELKKLNSGKDRLFSIISHDLRSPFNSLLGITDYALSDFHSLQKEELKEFLQSIHKSTRNLYTLIEDLLQWSRIQSGRIEYTPAAVSLRSAATKVISLLEGNAVKKGIALRSRIVEDVYAYADESMINSVLQNLVSNAIKFTPEGGRIEITSRCRSNSIVETSVSDTGTGMEPQVIERLFSIDSNFTLPGTNMEKGTGLGLIICKEFIEMNKGQITVESQPGKGTSFRFTLPLLNWDKIPGITN